MKAASFIKGVFVDDFNICVTVITNIKNKAATSVLLFIILKLIQQVV